MVSGETPASLPSAAAAGRPVLCRIDSHPLSAHFVQEFQAVSVLLQCMCPIFGRCKKRAPQTPGGRDQVAWGGGRSSIMRQHTQRHHSPRVGQIPAGIAEGRRPLVLRRLVKQDSFSLIQMLFLCRRHRLLRGPAVLHPKQESAFFWTGPVTQTNTAVGRGSVARVIPKLGVGAYRPFVPAISSQRICGNASR